MALAAGGGTMTGKVVVMTGATSGLGAVAAEVLASRGARLVLIARDRTRAEAIVDRLRRANAAATPTVHYADLSRLSEMKRVAAAVATAEPRIDVLANNAGGLFWDEELTEDGLERTFATNHMAYLVLTLGLREPLVAAGAARVVNTASAAHRGARYDPADVQSLRAYNGLRAYARSKLYNILFTRELSRRWVGLGVTVNALHPGFVATRFGDNNGGWLAPAIKAAKLFAISPEKGARTLVTLAAAPEVAGFTGRYFANSRPIEPQAGGRDDAAAAALWTESLRLGALAE